MIPLEFAFGASFDPSLKSLNLQLSSLLGQTNGQTKCVE